jgi:hypothetical protein
MSRISLKNLIPASVSGLLLGFLTGFFLLLPFVSNA